MLRNRNRVFQSPPPAPRPGPIRSRSVILLCAALFSLCVQCTPEERRQALSIFFDGVTGPEQAKKPEDETELLPEDMVVEAAPKVVTIKHKPYEDGQCDECHSGRRMQSRQTASARELCSKCHIDFGKDWKYWHGPVASWSCNACHSAHESEFEKLLVKPVGELCSKCHDTASEAFTSSNDAHGSEEECTLCHNPHGASDRFLLGD